MRKFEKISIWTPEGEKYLDTINLRIVEDNLKNSMTLYYELGYENIINSNEKEKNSVFVPVYSGNITLQDTEEKAEYTDLDTNNGIDINEEIFRVVAKKLNLILII